MSDNKALVTDAAKAAVQFTLDDYAAGVADHLSGDWGKHNQLRVYNAVFREPVSTHQISAKTARMRLTKAGVEITVGVPIFTTGLAPDPGGLPLIALQPQSQSVEVGGTAIFTVTAAASITITYQWRKNGSNMTGKTQSTLVLTNIQTSDQAIYSVVASTATGSVTSADATLTVTSA